MSDPQPRHVRPNPIPQRLSPGPDISGPQASFQRSWPDMSSPRPGHVWISNTSTARFSWGAIKDTPHLSSTVGHLFHIVNNLRHSLELPNFLLPASLKSKIPRRDLSLTLEWHTRSSSQALYWRSPCVHYSWEFVLLDGLCCSGVTKVVVDPRKFILPSPLWRFDSVNQTRSWWSFRVD
jgi:hypothetical protein